MTTEERKIANENAKRVLGFMYYMWSNPLNLIFTFKIARIRSIRQNKTVYKQSKAAVQTEMSFEKMMGF